MALKTVIESTEGLNEALIPFYTETDGKFVLQIDGIQQHPEVANLSNAYEAVKADRNTIREERDTLKTGKVELPEGFTLEKWNALKDGKPDEAALVALRETLEAERDAAIAERDAAKEAGRKTAIERDLTDALTVAGVTNPAFAKAARQMLADGVQIDASGKPIIETDMGPLALTDHVKRWAAGEGKDFVTAPKGGGSQGGGDGGPKALKDMGDAERMELAQAGQLKTQT